MNLRHNLQRMLLACFLLILSMTPGVMPAARAQAPQPASPAPRQAPAWPPRPDPLLPDLQPEPLAGLAAAYCYESGGEYTHVVYMSYRDVKWEIYYTNGCGNEAPVQRLTNNSAFDGYPRFDLNSARIVFVSDRDGNDELYSMDLAGEDVQRLTADPAADSYPAWSPDGQQVVFVSDRAGDPDLYLMDRDGANARRLAALPGLDSDPAWAPDGQSIVWVHWSSAALGKIYSLPLAGGAPAALTADLAAPSRPALTQGGERLFFSADVDGNGWIDLAWLNLAQSQLVWRSCSSLTWAVPCDFRVSGTWPAKGYAGRAGVGSIVTYVTNGATLYVKNSQLTEFYLYADGSDCWPVSGFYNSLLDFYPDAGNTDTVAPVSRVLPLPAFSPASGFSVRVTASDRGAGGLSYVNLLGLIDPSSSWGNLRSQQIAGGAASATFDLGPLYFNPGSTVSFNSSATDRASNSEAYRAQPDTTTRVYAWAALGRQTDQRGHPLDGVMAAVTPAAMNQPVSDAGGAFNVYFDQSGAYEALISHPGYLGLPPLRWESGYPRDLSFLSVLPAGSNLLQNGQFEDPSGALNGWQAGGALIPTGKEGHTGESGAAVGPACAAAACLSAAEALPVNPYATTYSSLAVTPDGGVHLLFNDPNYDRVSILSRAPGGQWSELQTVVPLAYSNTGNYLSPLQAGPAGELAFLQKKGSAPLSLYYKPAGGAWTSETLPVYLKYTALRFDGLSRLHLLYADGSGRLVYTRRAPDGAWSTPLLIDDAHNPIFFDLAPAEDGSVHIGYFWSDRHTFAYVRLRPGGDLGLPETLRVSYSDSGYPYDIATRLFASPGGSVHVVTSGGASFYFRRDPVTGWSTPAGIDSLYDPQNLYDGYYLDASMDAAGNLMLFVAGQSGAQRGQIFALVLPPGQEVFRAQPLAAAVDYYYTDPFLAEDGSIHLLTREGGNMAYQFAARAGENQAGSLSQAVTLPASLYKPTLSFLYRLQQFLPEGQSSLQVELTPQGGSAARLFTLSEQGDWQHAWADLTPWLGQTVTLTFRLDQAAGEFSARALLDEITVSEWTALYITAVEVSAPQPLTDWRSVPVTVTVRGENFAEGVRVRLGGQEIAAERLSETELIFTLPADFPPGKHTLVLVNPGGAQAAAPDPLRLGLQLFLPALTR